MGGDRRRPRRLSSLPMHGHQARGTSGSPGEHGDRRPDHTLWCETLLQPAVDRHRGRFVSPAWVFSLRTRPTRTRSCVSQASPVPGRGDHARARARPCGGRPCPEGPCPSRVRVGLLFLDDGRARFRVPTESFASRRSPAHRARVPGRRFVDGAPARPLGVGSRHSRAAVSRSTSASRSCRPGLAARCRAWRLSGVLPPAHRARGARPIRWLRR